MKKHFFITWMASALLFILTLFAVQSFTLKSLLTQDTSAQVTSVIMPSGDDVCAIVTSMPGAKNTEELLSLLRTNRKEVIEDLEAMKANMKQYDAEGYGWQNVIDGSSTLEPRPSSWLIGALRMTCNHENEDREQ